MIKCGITGSTGILGTEIIKNLPYKFIRFKGNITSISDIKKWLDENNFHIIIHLSSIVPVNQVNKNYLYAKRVNYIGTKNLVDLILKSKTKPSWFFFASTSHVYKTTKNLKKISETSKNSASSRYGHTKKLAENYIKNQLKSKKIKYCIGRIFSFTHENQKKSFVIPSLYSKIKFNKKIILKNINHYRDFLSTLDICKAIEALRRSNYEGTINIGSGKATSLIKIAKFFAKHFNKKIVINNKENTTYLIANINKIKRIGWRPKDKLEDILKKFI